MRLLTQALDDQEALARRARQRVLTTYTWRRTAENYLSVIGEAAEMSRRPAAEVPELDASALIRAFLAAK